MEPIFTLMDGDHAAIAFYSFNITADSVTVQWSSFGEAAISGMTIEPQDADSLQRLLVAAMDFIKSPLLDGRFKLVTPIDELTWEPPTGNNLIAMIVFNDDGSVEDEEE